MKALIIMTYNIQFTHKGIKSLAKELNKPFTQISVAYPDNVLMTDKNRWASSLTLWGSDRTGLRVISIMNDIAHRVEVGSLSFARVERVDKNDVFFKLPGSYSNETILQKIIINESGSRIETGIQIAAPNGSQILIVPNAMPQTLAIQCDDIALEFFEPEYSLEDYAFEDWLPIADDKPVFTCPIKGVDS